MSPTSSNDSSDIGRQGLSAKTCQPVNAGGGISRCRGEIRGPARSRRQSKGHREQANQAAPIDPPQQMLVRIALPIQDTPPEPFSPQYRLYPCTAARRHIPATSPASGVATHGDPLRIRSLSCAGVVRANNERVLSRCEAVVGAVVLRGAEKAGQGPRPSVVNQEIINVDRGDSGTTQKVERIAERE